MKTKSVQTSKAIIECSNPYGILVFEDLVKEAQAQFDVEKNAKNKAYSFILSKGLLGDFSDFCKMSKSDDPHGDCLKMLELLNVNQN